MSKKNQLKTKLTSPLFISGYILLAISIITIGLFVIFVNQYFADPEFFSSLSYGGYMPEFGIGITLGIFFSLCVTLIVSVRNYRHTGIREFQILAVILASIIIIMILNFGMRIVFITPDSFFAFQEDQFGGILQNEYVIWLFYLDPMNILSFVVFPGELSVNWGIFLLNMEVVNSEIRPLLILFITIYPFLNTCFFCFVHFLIGVYFMRAIWGTIPKRNLGILGGLMSFALMDSLLSMLLPYSFRNAPNFLFETLLRLYLIDILFPSELIFQFIILCYIYLYLGRKMYLSIDPPKKTKQTLLAVKLWRVILILFCTLYLHVATSVFGLYFIYIFLYRLEIAWWPIVGQGIYFISLMVFFVILCLFCYLLVKYPEGKLIFETHLHHEKSSSMIISTTDTS